MLWAKRVIKFWRVDNRNGYLAQSLTHAESDDPIYDLAKSLEVVAKV